MQNRPDFQRAKQQPQQCHPSLARWQSPAPRGTLFHRKTLRFATQVPGREGELKQPGQQSGGGIMGWPPSLPPCQASYQIGLWSPRRRRRRDLRNGAGGSAPLPNAKAAPPPQKRQSPPEPSGGGGAQPLPSRLRPAGQARGPGEPLR